MSYDPRFDAPAPVYPEPRSTTGGMFIGFLFGAGMLIAASAYLFPVLHKQWNDNDIALKVKTREAEARAEADLEFRKTEARLKAEANAATEKLAKFDIEKGDVNNTFNRSLGRNVGLMGSVSKQDGKLKELMLIVAGGGDKAEDMLRPVVMILSASQALNPLVDKGENSKVVMDMAKQALANIDTGKPIERTMGQLQYTASASQLTGLMFAISPM